MFVQPGQARPAHKQASKQLSCLRHDFVPTYNIVHSLSLSIPSGRSVYHLTYPPRLPHHPLRMLLRCPWPPFLVQGSLLPRTTRRYRRRCCLRQSQISLGHIEPFRDLPNMLCESAGMRSLPADLCVWGGFCLRTHWLLGTRGLERVVVDGDEGGWMDQW